MEANILFEWETDMNMYNIIIREKKNDNHTHVYDRNVHTQNIKIKKYIHILSQCNHLSLLFEMNFKNIENN